MSESEFIVPSFPIPAHWPRAYGMAINWQSTAVIWGALDRESDIRYLYSEYQSRERQPPVHAQAIRSRGSWISGVLDSGSTGASQDRYRLIELYRKVGLKLESARNLGSLAFWRCCIE